MNGQEREIHKKLMTAKTVIAKLPTKPETTEQIGAWLWLTFASKPDDETRSQMKSAGFRWASKKAKWYFAAVPSAGRGKKSIEEIRDKYGSVMVRV